MGLSLHRNTLTHEVTYFHHCIAEGKLNWDGELRKLTATMTTRTTKLNANVFCRCDVGKYEKWNYLGQCRLCNVIHSTDIVWLTTLSLKPCLQQHNSVLLFFYMKASVHIYFKLGALINHKWFPFCGQQDKPFLFLFFIFFYMSDVSCMLC